MACCPARRLTTLSAAFVAILLAQSGAQAQQSGAYSDLVSKHAANHGLPESLVHRIIMRESRYNPRAVARGNYGMMQIRLATARAMGYRGDAAGLLDPDVNMTYAVKYLAGAYRAAGGNADRAVGLYARGYHDVAKRRGTTAVALANADSSAPVAMPMPVAAADDDAEMPITAPVAAPARGKTRTRTAPAQSLAAAFPAPLPPMSYAARKARGEVIPRVRYRPANPSRLVTTSRDDEVR